MSEAGRATGGVSPSARSILARIEPYRLWLAAALLLVALPFIPGLTGNFGRSLLSQMGIATVFALSYNLLLGQTGLLSFGHAVYFGLGGYAAIHLMRAINGGLPIPMPLVPVAGAATGLFFGLLFGSVTVRRAGVIFALISLGVGELVYALLRMLSGVSGGEEGITANRGMGPHLLGLSFAPQLQVYYVIAFWTFISAVLMFAFLRTPVGRLCNAVRDNAERAEFIGYDPVRVRLVVLAVAAMFAGLAGGLHALNYEIVASEAAGTGRSGAVLLMAYIGGVANFLGAILGAVTITWLQVSLSDYTSAWQLYLGLFFMLFVLFAPRGLAGLIVMHRDVVQTRAFLALLRAYAIALLPALVMAIGAIVMLEINYRRATQPEAGPKMTLFWVSIDSSTPWPWLAAIAMIAVGFWLFRASIPLVSRAWERASEAAHERAGAQR